MNLENFHNIDLEAPHKRYPATQPKTIEDSPLWELTKYRDISQLHDFAVQLAENMIDEQDPEKKQTLQREYKEYLVQLNEALLDSVATTRINLDLQEQYDLIEHRHVWTEETMQEELARGTKTLEMDIKSTADGQTLLSHRMKVGGDKIHDHNLEELVDKHDAFSLQAALEQFKPYSQDHELVLELKDIKAVEDAAKLIEAYGLQDRVRVASLSASILEAMHERLPEIKGLILNGGVVPFITTPLVEKPQTGVLERFVMKDNKEWKATRLGPMEVVFAADSFPTATEATERAEGVGKYMAHVFFRLPDKLKDMLKGDKSAISLSAVLIAANIISIISPKTGKEILKSYKAMADAAGLRTMATTWMEKLGSRVESLKAEEQFKLLQELGIDTIYTTNPVGLAKKIKNQTLK